jgi:DNA-binding NtrC family response regulator
MSMTKNILFIDDEKDATLTIKIILEESGLFHVVTFNDPESALKRFKPNFYALVLIDIKMPKVNGFELYEQLKKIDPHVKVCFLTASEMYRPEVRELEHCALNEELFLQKPISGMLKNYSFIETTKLELLKKLVEIGYMPLGK